VDGISTAIEVDGVAETIKALGRVDPELKKQIVKNLKAAASPVEESARALVPTARPLSGWEGWKGGYDPVAIRRGIRVAFRGSKVRGARDPDKIPLLTLRQKNAAGAIYDMAGRRSSGNTDQGRVFIRMLNARGGPASRYMWPGAEAAMPAVVRQVEVAINDMMEVINTEIR